MTDAFRLTSLAHGGGCGCKIAPGVLTDILKATPFRLPPAALMVGADNNEDAAVYRLNDYQAIVATTDFFTPIVDDPYDFDEIVAKAFVKVLKEGTDQNWHDWRINELFEQIDDEWAATMISAGANQPTGSSELTMGNLCADQYAFAYKYHIESNSCS
jgi:selenophosphate synthase